MPKNPKLNEIIAVATGRKGTAQKRVTDIHHQMDREALFDGLSRTYRPRNEDGDRLPDEHKNPQLRAAALAAEAKAVWQELFDLTLTLDAGNCVARADVAVDEQVILADVPATSLLFLEKQLADVRTFVAKLPTPDPAEQWVYDANQDCLATRPSQKVRTVKVQKPIVLYDATREHPAQTQLISEDVAAGDWTTILYTTRVPAARKAEMLARADRLIDAVKSARERANSIEVEKKKASGVLDYVFAPLVAPQ